MNTLSQSVLITGASSGIGKAIALHLAKQGFTVLATVRKESDSEKLNTLGIKNLIPLYPLDLTIPDQIHSITEKIKQQIADKDIPALYGIVNVAGGGQVAPIELMNINAFRGELEKRLVGPVILLQQLLPILRETQGRVLWISTPGLFPVPYVADIHAPDFAVNYLARTLNLELKPDGIKNILIRCGGIDTTSPQKSDNILAEKFNQWPKEKLDIYKARLTKLRTSLKEFDSKRTPPEKVANLVGNVLIAKRPKTRYQIGYMSGMGAFLEKLPQSWTDFIMSKREKT